MRIASKATKGKGKRWTKGGSSSCNPDNRRHRSAVKCVTPLATHSGLQSRQSLQLSEDVLSQHNSIQLQKLRLDNQTIDGSNDNKSEVESIGGQSFASVWTNCSNISFNKLLLGFDSSSVIQKQMLSILAAITETITSNGGKESETEYFAALMTGLGSIENEETLTAILGLIQMVIKRLPQNVIRLKFSETSKVFVEYLAKYIKGENGLIVRSLTNSLALLLQPQEYVVWELSSTKHIFEIILSLSVHNKPRIRKCAQKAIARIVRSDTNQWKSSSCHPSARLAADFCVRKLEENGINDNINSTLYILSLLTDILSVLPNPWLKKSCESMLTQMTFGNVLVVSTAFKAFYVLFAAKPAEDILSPDLNAKLISALYDYQPNINDSQPLCAWAQAMKHAFINLYRIDKRFCFNHLPKLFNTSMACLLSDSKEVYLSLANNLKQIYTECIAPSDQEIDKSIAEKIYSSVEKALQYEFCNAWVPLFGLISHIFNNNFSEFTTNIINKLITIRESFDCIYATDIDRTIGRAIQVFGPKYVVHLCPLNLNDDNTDVSHNWLLPVLRDNVKNTEMSFFIEYFVPMTTLLYNSCKTKSESNSISLKTSSILLSQIWSLFPSFCIRPKDFDQSFKNIAQNLGSILSNKPSLRGHVFTGFRNISKCFDENVFKTTLSRFSRNFIPILFNIYTNEQNLTEDKNQRFSAFEVILIFISVSDKSLLMSLFSKLIEKLENCENNANLRQSLMDLIRAFVPYVTKEDLKQIYNQLVVPFIGDNKLITEQKKAFRILEEICKSDSNVCLDFVNNNFNDILNVLIESLSKCLSSSKSYALKALKEIIEKNLSKESIDWKIIFQKMITKILNCLVINSQKLKTSSLDLMVCIANAYKSLNGENIEEFMKTMLSFLQKPEYSSSAVIICLRRLYTEFANQIPKHIECDLVDNIVSNIGSDNRQTIQSSLDFVKFFFRNASADQLSTYLELLITKLSNINLKHRKHFRVKIREMFVRLVRKYGFVMISKMIPEEYKKVLKNIRKVEDRKRKQTEKDSESDAERQTVVSKRSNRKNEFQDIIGDTSDEESEDGEQMTNVSKKNNKTWIKEESDENEIIDLLSSQISQNILHKNPNLKPKEKKQSFEMSSDGKLVIRDLDSHKTGLKRGHDEDMEEEVDDSDDEVMSAKQSVKTSKSKASGYKTGGKGIHRSIDRETGEEYKSKKAKGDMKRKGRPDPFAYIPLNKQYLNKRKKAKMSGRFNNLVKAAKKGANVGSNHKSNKRHKK